MPLFRRQLYSTEPPALKQDYELRGSSHAHHTQLLTSSSTHVLCLLVAAKLAEGMAPKKYQWALEIISSCGKLQKKKERSYDDPAPDDFFIFQQSAINYPETEIDS